MDSMDSMESVESVESVDHHSKLVVAWRGAQYAGLLAGVALVAALLLRPALGLDLLWNGLIPLAPVLLVVAPGLWRNICPLGTMSLLGRGLWGRGPWGHGHARLSPKAVAALGWASAGLLVFIIPVRHLALDRSGPLTALMLVLAGAVAMAMGARFEGRGGWCTALCPIHPVEKLYGFAPAWTWTNQRCDRCVGCVRPCPDSARPKGEGLLVGRGWASILVTGGFVGFIWGWYQVPDAVGSVGAGAVAEAFWWPLAGAAGSQLVYGAAGWWGLSSPEAREWRDRLFATAAVSMYYWYRLPALVGLGPFAHTGTLVDLAQVLPGWAPFVSRAMTTSFFVWFLLIRSRTGSPGRAWLERPVARPRPRSLVRTVEA